MERGDTRAGARLRGLDHIVRLRMLAGLVVVVRAHLTAYDLVLIVQPVDLRFARTGRAQLSHPCRVMDASSCADAPW